MCVFLFLFYLCSVSKQVPCLARISSGWIYRIYAMWLLWSLAALIHASPSSRHFSSVRTHWSGSMWMPSLWKTQVTISHSSQIFLPYRGAILGLRSHWHALKAYCKYVYVYIHNIQYIQIHIYYGNNKNRVGILICIHRDSCLTNLGNRCKDVDKTNDLLLCWVKARLGEAWLHYQLYIALWSLTLFSCEPYTEKPEIWHGV